jgi:hypothetical protein
MCTKNTTPQKHILSSDRLCLKKGSGPTVVDLVHVWGKKNILYKKVKIWFCKGIYNGRANFFFNVK